MVAPTSHRRTSDDRDASGDPEEPAGPGPTAGGMARWELPVPGAFVRNPDRADWGLGQVQSVIGNRITVNFENAGKLLIIADAVRLETVDPSKEG